MKVPFIDLPKHHAGTAREILSAWQEILDSGQFVGGEPITSFEKAFADACQTKYAVAVSSGTDALRLILIALGLRPGDEVVTAPNTFIATTEAISQAGGSIVFADIDSRTYNLDPDSVESAITPATKAIVPVHLYGQTADMDPLLALAEKHGLWVVEDACQAHLAEYRGRKAGSIGNAAAFSFYPGKNLGACGEAGAVTTNDYDVAEKVRRLRDHGQIRKYHHAMEGYNCRCDALQAAALGIKLRFLADWNQKRRERAAQYCRLLAGSDSVLLPHTLEGCFHVYHLFVVQVENRDRVADCLSRRGVSPGFHYPVPLHLQKAYAAMDIREGAFPVAERVARRLLSLPMFPELTEEQVSYVCCELASCSGMGEGRCYT